MFNDVVSGKAANAEFTYSLVSNVSQYFGFGVYGVFFIYSAISIFGKLYFINNHITFKKLAAILYLCSFFILYEFVQMRASSALGLFLVFLTLYYKGASSWKVLLALVLSLSFHYSMIVLFFCFILSESLLRMGRYKNLALDLLSIFMILVSCYIVIGFFISVPSLVSFMSKSSLSFLIPSRIYEGYFLNDDGVFSTSSKMLLSASFTVVVSFLLLTRNLALDKAYFFSSISILISSLIYFSIGTLEVVADRLSELCIIFVIVVADGLLKKKRYFGICFYFAILLIFSYNTVFRATYFSFL